MGEIVEWDVPGRRDEKEENGSVKDLDTGTSAGRLFLQVRATYPLDGAEFDRAWSQGAVGRESWQKWTMRILTTFDSRYCAKRAEDLNWDQVRV